MVYAMIITSDVSDGLISLSEHYSYLAVFPVHSLLLCLIRGYVLWTPKMLPPKKEEEALEDAMVFLSLAHSKGLFF